MAKAETTENKLKEARFRAQTATHPSVNAALVIEKFGDHFGDLDVAALAVHLKDAMNDISKNDLSSCEAMLYSQAQALQMIFVSAALQVPDQNWFSNSEAYLPMALKAQSQCRATLETLAQIKNPQPVAFVGQANIAHGPQQVNNGMMPAGEPRAGAGKTEKPQNELLEEKPHERLDTGTTGAAVGADTHLAAVGENDRTEDAAR
jgi:hypothetical protein